MKEMRYDTDAIKRVHPLAEVVAGYGVQLFRSGRESLQGCCPFPFHQDDTPSFTIYVRDNAFICFGCGQRGDVIRFIQLHEGLDFPAACAHLLGAPPPPPLPASVGQRWRSGGSGAGRGDLRHNWEDLLATACSRGQVG